MVVGVGVVGGCHWIAEHLVSFDEFDASEHHSVSPGMLLAPKFQSPFCLFVCLFLLLLVLLLFCVVVVVVVWGVWGGGVKREVRA